MDKKDKDEFVKLIANGFQEVMIPALENMETRLRNDLASREDAEELKRGVDSLNRKFDAQQERVDRYGKRLDKHEERIQTLETASL